MTFSTLTPKSDTTERLQFVLDEGAIKPTRAHEGDLGFDLYSNETISFQPGDIKLVDTGVRCKFPYMYGAFLKDRSSVASQQHMFIHAGVIDSGYRGPIKVLFHNAGKYIRVINKGDKIAQMVLLPVVRCPVDVIEKFEDETTRNENGFGSTGK